MELLTKNHYHLGLVASVLQKCIRRNQPDLAGWAAIELLESNYHAYLWRRLLVISAEDCAGVITKEIIALQAAHEQLATSLKRQPKIFAAKAVMLMCAHPKNRDADHLAVCIVADDVDKAAERFLAEIQAEHKQNPKPEIPDFAYDYHFPQGRRKGKTKDSFIRDEHAALAPFQQGHFDWCAERHNPKGK